MKVKIEKALLITGLVGIMAGAATMYAILVYEVFAPLSPAAWVGSSLLALAWTALMAFCTIQIGKA